MSQIHARFRLDEVTRIQMSAKNPSSGEWGYVPGVRVKLYPVQGEPFGSATPGGQLEMAIANPAAAAVFNDAKLGQEFDAIFSPVVKEEHKEVQVESAS